MIQEDKELLVKDLCARLVYGVILNITLKDKYDEIINRNIKLTDDNLTYITRDSHWRAYKPYLRSMSNMTKDEREEYELLANHCIVSFIGFIHLEAAPLIDWLNAHHFDYRGLIEKGLAIEVTKENNPYKE